MTPIETVQAQVLKALRTAWRLGQVYWQQADSDSYAQHKKADETLVKFDTLLSETAALLAQETAASRATDEAEFELHVNGDYEASATGPRADAWREIQHYAAQYSQDGPAVIYEIKRVPIQRTVSL